MRVPWDRLDPQTIEQMIAVLLSLENPEVQRIDGRGGDGGRDAQFRAADRLDFYEIKSFADRIDARRNRRAQVERSLRTAAKLNPDSWTLVLPLDPTAAEEAWFNTLRAGYPFPLRLWGLTNWLEARVAAHPEVSAYYLQDQRDELLQLMQEWNAQAADVPDVDSALDRLQLVKDRLDKLDPHVTFEVSTLALEQAVRQYPQGIMFADRATALGRVTVVVVPRYAGATRDSALSKLRLSLRFPNTPEGQEARRTWESIHNWGEPGQLNSQFVEVQQALAPGGLGHRPGPAHLEFRHFPTDAEVSSGRLVCHRRGRRVAALPVVVSHIGSGQQGVSVGGRDCTGTLTFHARIGPPEVMLNLKCSPVTGRTPAELLPSLRLNEEAKRGAEVRLELDALLDEPLEFGSIGAADQARPGDAYLRFLEDLATVQDLTHTPFPVAKAVTATEVADTARLAAVLRNGQHDEEATDALHWTLAPAAPSLPSPSGYLCVESSDVIHLLGQDFDIGPWNMVSGPWRIEESSAPNGPPGSRLVRAIPEEGARVRTRLGPLIDDPGPGQSLDPEALGRDEETGQG